MSLFNVNISSVSMHISIQQGHEGLLDPFTVVVAVVVGSSFLLAGSNAKQFRTHAAFPGDQRMFTTNYSSFFDDWPFEYLTNRPDQCGILQRLLACGQNSTVSTN